MCVRFSVVFSNYEASLTKNMTLKEPLGCLQWFACLRSFESGCCSGTGCVEVWLTLGWVCLCVIVCFSVLIARGLPSSLTPSERVCCGVGCELVGCQEDLWAQGRGGTSPAQMPWVKGSSAEVVLCYRWGPEPVTQLQQCQDWEGSFSWCEICLS